MDLVLLVTSADLPDGEPGGELLPPALAERGYDGRWVVWDDPAVDWSAAALVAVRSPWDYESRMDEFVGWSRSIAAPMLNGPEVFAWNLDKSYLVALAVAGLPVVPTEVVDGEEDLPAAIAAYDAAVVKPAIGAGGRGVVVFDGVDGGPADLDESGLSPGPWVVQPLVGSVRTEGEHSVFVLGGEPVSSVRKLPAGQEIRVHEHFGGSTLPVPLLPVLADLARRTVATASDLLGARLDYGRVDFLQMPDGAWVVSELEVTEPGLYLDVLPQNAAAFADLVAARLG